MRDAALDVGGLLSRKLGGPSVFPAQPAGVMETRRSRIPWNASPGEDQYRRGMYTHFWRTSPYPFLIAFDAPKSEVTCTRRTRSNTPLQALALLNETPFLEAARGLAAQALAAPMASDSDRARWAFRKSVSREPTPAEQARLNELLASQLAEFQADPAGAKQLVGAAPPPAGGTLEQWAAWTAFSRVLLNLDEFITRE